MHSTFGVHRPADGSNSIGDEMSAYKAVYYSEVDKLVAGTCRLLRAAEVRQQWRGDE